MTDQETKQALLIGIGGALLFFLARGPSSPAAEEIPGAPPGGLPPIPPVSPGGRAAPAPGPRAKADDDTPPAVLAARQKNAEEEGDFADQAAKKSGLNDSWAAAAGLQAYLSAGGRAGIPVAKYQKRMGQIAADGIPGIQTRARIRALTLRP